MPGMVSDVSAILVANITCIDKSCFDQYFTIKTRHKSSFSPKYFKKKLNTYLSSAPFVFRQEQAGIHAFVAHWEEQHI